MTETKLITKQDFEDAAPWTIFQGKAEDPGIRDWALFSGFDVPDGSAEKIETLGYEGGDEEPEIFNDHDYGKKVDDLDAALRYLSLGGTLCKVPDAEGSPYYRMIAVWRLQTKERTREYETSDVWATRICDVISVHRTVELPMQCPKCGETFGQDNQVRLYEYQDQGRMMYPSAGTEEYPDLPEGGDTTLPLELVCASCDYTLVKSEEVDVYADERPSKVEQIDKAIKLLQELREKITAST